MALLSGLLLCAASPAARASSAVGEIPAGGTGSFTDIAGNFAEPQIRALLDSGVLQVPADGRFRPSDPVTRVTFAVWVARALELPAGGPGLRFTDAGTIAQADRADVAAAVRAGLLQGYPDGSFRPAAQLTRGEMGVIFGRALEKYGERPDPRFLNEFADAASIPAWVAPAALAVADGLIYGRPGPTRLAIFAPDAPTTRAETVVILSRFLRYVQRYRITQPLAPPPSPPPGTTPSGPAGPFRLGFWYSNSDEAYTNLQAHGTSLNWLVYTGYNLEADGSLIGYDSPRTLAWVRAHPLRLDFMFQNDWPNDSFLRDQAAQQAAVANVLAVLRRAGYAGVNVDIEGVPAGDRQAFTRFVTALAAAVHAAGRSISVDVPGETSSAPTTWGGAFDYAALGAAVDHVVVMAYDYHYAGSDPGPVAPLDWTRQVLAYATSAMPAGRVILGLPAYGYLWASSGKAVAYWESGMENQAQSHGVTARYDATAGEATYAYTAAGQSYTGWFVDPQGLAARLQLAHGLGIGGVIAWRLDYNTTDWWSVWSAGTTGG